MDESELAEWVARSRKSQGLPKHIADPSFYQAVSSLLDSPDDLNPIHAEGSPSNGIGLMENDPINS